MPHTTIQPRRLDENLTRTALTLVRSGTTQQANDVLRVPLDFYRDPDVLQRERDLIEVTPLPLVATCQIPAANDYIVREVLGRSVLISRGEDGVAHAFLNYCRHRGARPASGCGNARHHTCPYHAWTYDSGGALTGVAGRPTFGDIDTTANGLVALPTEERHGFIWVALTAGIDIDVASHLGPFDDELAQWNYASYGWLTEREFTTAVNWKNGIEAFTESYHFPFVHGESIIGMNTVGNTCTQDAFGPHQRIGFPLKWITELADNPEADPNPRLNMGVAYWIFPNLSGADSPLGVEIVDILPGNDPTESTVRHAWMATIPAVNDEMQAGYQDVYEQMHAAVRDEDFLMLPSCGDGVRNGQHEHMLIGRNEPGVQHVVTTVADRVGYELG